MLKDMKEFLLKGNLVDLAVAFVLGLAFAAVVNGLVDFVVNPFIAGILGQPDISGVLAFDIGDATVSIGGFLQEVLNFVIIGTVLFFIVRAYQTMTKQEEEVESRSDEVVLLTEIRDSLRAQG